MTYRQPHNLEYDDERRKGPRGGKICPLDTALSQFEVPQEGVYTQLVGRVTRAPQNRELQQRLYDLSATGIVQKPLFPEPPLNTLKPDAPLIQAWEKYAKTTACINGGSLFGVFAAGYGVGRLRQQANHADGERELIAELLKAIQPLVDIARAYESNNLDEARPEWGSNDRHGVPIEKTELFTGRGGATLLTLSQCLEAAEVAKRARSK